jgi:hypothetical protein
MNRLDGTREYEGIRLAMWPKEKEPGPTQWEEMDKIKIALINGTLPSATKLFSLTTRLSLGEGGCMHL